MSTTTTASGLIIEELVLGDGVEAKAEEARRRAEARLTEKLDDEEAANVNAALARETAQAEAMERIRKMPTKLDIVLSLCFLPPTVALVVVPTVVNLLNFLNDSMG